MTAELKEYMDQRFDRLECATLIGAKETLTAEEAALYTGYRIKGIYALTSSRQIPHYKKNGKLYFKKEELDRWMTESKVMSEQELRIKATTYVATKK